MPKPASEVELIASENNAWCICDVHGIQKAYYVCKHVQTVSDIKRLDPWEDFEGGQLCCAIPGLEHSEDDIHMLCEQHLKDRGLLPIM